MYVPRWGLRHNGTQRLCVCVLKSLLLMFTLSVCVSVQSFLFMCEVTKEGDS